jgi:hypothetical protein
MLMATYPPYHAAEATSRKLSIAIAMSDVDPGRLAGLIHTLEQSQTGAHPQST